MFLNCFACILCNIESEITQLVSALSVDFSALEMFEAVHAAVSPPQPSALSVNNPPI